MNLWKVLDLATRPGKPSNKVFQCFSMVHFPICILTYHEPWPLFLLYGETVALLRFFRFRVFPGSARALTMFPQLKHLRTSVHPKPPATHGHFGLCSFVQLRTYSLSSDSFLPSQLHWNCMYFWNCNIYTSGYKSGLLCGTGIYQKHRKYPKLTYFSCFYSKCILFPSLVRHSHSLTWNFWNMNTWTLSILAC